MSLRRIMVPVRGDGRGQSVLTHAVRMGRVFSAHIEAVHCRARPQDLIPYGVVVPSVLREQIKTQAKDLADEEEAYLKGLFEATMAEAGVEVIASDALPPRDRISAAWYEAPGKMVDVVRRYGRLADLIAVAKPDRDRNLGVNTLRTALFSTGRPVLLCPPREVGETLGRRLAIAWNGSLEVARTLALSLPLIEAAEQVTVIDGAPPGEGVDGPALVRYLSERGLAVSRRVASGEPSGVALLAEAEASGADLMVMGAYGHSREVEAVLGGATQDVVDETALPILFAH